MNISDDEIKKLKSMSKYWKEVSTRNNYSEIANHELESVLNTIGSCNMLEIILDWVKKK